MGDIFKNIEKTGQLSRQLFFTFCRFMKVPVVV